MAPKVSVIVAVFNPGANIDPLIQSLEVQSLAPGDLEVIFVDDGSTDGTYTRLEDTLGSRPGFTVTSIPNSGWPGRPRNVGTDLSTGDYVFFADHDDEFFPEALERMHAMAVDNHADIVYGKVVGLGRQTPFWQLAARDIPVADVGKDDLVASRTVHKLFRRAFLVDNNIRFPEGRVRLEDHNFMAQALPLAKVVSVLASYPCYRWVKRTDGTNSSSAEVDFDAYWGYFGEALSIFRQKAGAGPKTDAALLSACERIFLPISPHGYFKRTDAENAAVLKPLADLVQRHLPPTLDHRIPVLKRLRIQALRKANWATFERLQRFAAATKSEVRLRGVASHGSQTVIDVEASLTRKKGPAVVMHYGEGLLLSVNGKLDRELPTRDRALLASDQGELEVSIRHRASGVEWPVDCTQNASVVEGKRGVTLAVTCQATVDGTSNSFGSPLDLGIWDVLTRTRFLGEMRVSRLAVDAAALSGQLSAVYGTQRLRVYRTTPGNLALKLTQVQPAAAVMPSDAVGPCVVSASWEGELLALTMRGAKGTPLGRGLRLLVRARDGSASAEFRIHEGLAQVALPRSEPGGVFDFYLVERSWVGKGTEGRLAFGLEQVTQREPYQIYHTVLGGFSVKRLRTSTV